MPVFVSILTENAHPIIFTSSFVSLCSIPFSNIPFLKKTLFELKKGHAPRPHDKTFKTNLLGPRVQCVMAWGYGMELTEWK